MRRTLVIIVTIGVLGLLGLYADKHNSNQVNAKTPAITTTQLPSTNSSSAGSSSTNGTSKYKNGTFTGSTSDTAYGPVRVSAVISNGRISDINFLQMPSDLGHSREVTAFSEPVLKQETISAQSAQIDFVSGATSTSEGYMQSLQAALDQAANPSSGGTIQNNSTPNSNPGSQPNPSGTQNNPSGSQNAPSSEHHGNDD